MFGSFELISVVHVFALFLEVVQTVRERSSLLLAGELKWL